MSSKTGAKGWSIRVRLTLWFGAAACALAGVVAGANYWFLEAHRDREADEGLAEWAADIHKVRDRNPDAYSGSGEYPLRVIGPDQRVRYESPAMAAFAVSAFPEPTPTGVDGTVGTDCTVGGRSYRLVSCRIEGWTYQFAYDRTANVNLFAQHRRNLLLAVTPTVVLALLGGYVLTWRGLRPLREVATTVRGVAPGHLGNRIPVAALPAELWVVADAFNEVMDRLQDAFARLDQFAADVAHELRTPVHNLRGGIEVALGQDRTPDDYRRALGAALNEADRIGRLVDRLLFLAQAEDPRREVRREATDVAMELNDVREFFAPVAAEAGVTVCVVAAVLPPFPLDRALFQRAVSNLVSNGLAHTPTGGSVKLIAEADQTGLCVAVADTGTGIPPEDIPQLFDRFFRSRAARASGRGVGLGLAIVRRVTELHGGGVTVESEPGRGTVVRMTFPSPPAHDTDVITAPRG
jgi:two-component system heavy metal sensor histidine kinase CusS